MDSATSTETYNNENRLPEVFLDVLRPVFLKLSETNLLKRCVFGTTQNPNKCLNSLVWVRCPKQRHHGVKLVRCAVASAVCHFRGGSSCQERVMERLMIPAGRHTKRASMSKDKKRATNAHLATSQKAKKRRQAANAQRTQREEAIRNSECTTYEAGAF